MSAAVAPAVAPKPAPKPAHAHSASQSAPRKVRFNVGECLGLCSISEVSVCVGKGSVEVKGRVGRKARPTDLPPSFHLALCFFFPVERETKKLTDPFSSVSHWNLLGSKYQVLDVIGEGEFRNRSFREQRASNERREGRRRNES